MSKLPALVSFALLAVLAVVLWGYLRADHERVLEERSRAEARVVGEEIRRAIDVHVFALEGMARAWERAREPDRETFEATARPYRERFEAVQAVEWVDPEGRIRWIVPESGNESALGLEPDFEEGRREAMLRARETGRPAASPAVDLVQGGRGVLVFVPLQRGDSWGGYILGVYRFEALLDSVLRFHSNQDFSISKSGQLLSGPEASVAGAGHGRSEFEVLGESWTVARAEPTGEDASIGPPEAVLAIGLLLALAVSISVHLYRRYCAVPPPGREDVGFSLGFRLIAGFLLVAGLGGAISTLSAFRIERRVQELGRLEAPLLFELQGLSSSFNAATQEGFAYLLSDEVIEKDEHVQHRRVFLESLERLSAATRDDAGGVPGLGDVAALAPAMWAVWDRLFEAHERGEPLELELFHEIESYVDAVSRDLGDAIAGQRSDVDVAFAGAGNLARTSKTLVFGGGFVTALVAVLIGLLMASTVTRNVDARLRAESELVERRRREAEIVEAQLDAARHQLVSRARLATIGQVSAGIAHDLRNPLGAIRNAAFFLKRRLRGSGQEVAEHLETVDQEVAVSDAIISRLLDLARERPPRKQPEDLRQIAEQALGRAHLPAGVSWELDLDPEPFVVFSDRVLLRQLLQNLLRNAADALQGNGHVRIRARHGELMDEITVLDDGSGVPEELRGQLFEPFFTGKDRGTGLGLTICRQIAAAHGGSIEAAPHDPDAEATGAAFELRLPRESPAVLHTSEVS